MTGDLGQLRGLHPQRPGSSQRDAPLTGRPNRHRDQPQRDDASMVQMNGRLPVVAVVDAHHDRHEDQPEQRPGHLLEQVVIRGMVCSIAITAEAL